MTSPYVELHAHSGYSFLDGASHPEELVMRALELGYPALALTDHNGLYGSMEFARAARDAGLAPITGAEVTLAPLPFEEPPPDPLPPGYPEVPDRGTHVTLLAETPRGYANLCRLLSECHLRSPREDPRLPLESLLGRTEGLILLTGCRRSPLHRALEDSVASGEALLRRMVEAFGAGNVFVELQDNQVRGDGERIRSLCRLADRVQVPVVATGNVHYHREERHRLQDTLVAIRNRTTLDGSHSVRRGNARFHLEAPGVKARRFVVKENDSIVIWGGGKVGQSILQAAKLFTRNRIFLVDILDKRLQRAKTAYPDIETINSAKTDPVEYLKSATQGKGVDIAFEAVGHPEKVENEIHPIRSCIRAIRGGGIVCVLGLSDEPVPMVMKELIWKEANIITSRVSHGEFSECIEHLEKGNLKPESLISMEIEASRAQEAFELLESEPENHLKIILNL